MVCIGILAPDTKSSIEFYLKGLLGQKRKKYVTFKHTVSDDVFFSLSESKIDYCIIELEKNFCHYVDILILDTKNKALVKNIVKCISPTTHLIYNIDNGFPCITNRYAISYGLSTNATATVSSIDDYEVIYCLQHPILTLNEHFICQSEVLVKTQNQATKVNRLLPAVTCGIICEIITDDILNV